MTKISDTQAACNLIKRIRRQKRHVQIHKQISIPLLEEEGCKIYGTLKIEVRKSTKHENFISSLLIYYKNKITQVYPTTHNRLRCTNIHALDLLKKERGRDRRNTIKNMKKTVFNWATTISENVVMIERLKYRANGGIYYTTPYFKGCNGVYLKIIDI